MNFGDHRGFAAAVVTGVLTFAGFTCFGYAFAAQQQPPPQPPLSTAEAVTALAGNPTSRLQPTTVGPKVVGPVLPRSAPVTLAIPAIGVRSTLLRLGLTADGAMETPRPGPTYDRAGWYRYSPAPGSLGPAIIAGHIDSAKNGPSVFFRLGSLRPHDTVKVTRADGSVAVFEVDSVRRYSKDRFPTQLIYGDTNRAALRLITCGGRFDTSSRNYVDNIVVFASLVTATGVPAAQVTQPAAPTRGG